MLKLQPLLTKWSEKAHAALTAAALDAASAPNQDGAMWTVKIEDDGDELEIFAGKTRLVETKRPSLTPPSNASAEQSPPQGQPQAQQSLPASDVAMYAALQGPPATVAGNAPAPVVNPLSQLTATGATQAATMGNAVNGG